MDSGKYRLGERIGGGGMAEVFRATLMGVEGFARPVAIKRMLPTLSADDAFAEMFVNEARLASLLAHANVVNVVDFDRDAEGRLFIVMELVEGRDLRELVEGGRLPVAVGAFIIAEVLRGLAFAHELANQGKPMGMVHRDVSPHNVLISWSGAVKLSDFGIAKAMGAAGASRTGSLKGKVGYMSPEQAHAVAIDGRSDVFAVGVMFHELLTGERLFAGATEAEVLSRTLAQPIESPHLASSDISEDLAAVCMGMLERDRDRRFNSARAALEALLNCDIVSARGESELSALIRGRFPSAAPVRAADAPAVLAGGSATAPMRAPSSAVAAAMEAPTRTAGAGDKTATPTAAGQRLGLAATVTDVEAAPRRRLGWVSGVLAAAAIGAAIVATVVITGRGAESPARIVRRSVTIDAGLAAARTPRVAAMAVAGAAVDAAPSELASAIADRSGRSATPTRAPGERAQRARDKRRRDVERKRAEQTARDLAASEQASPATVARTAPLADDEPRPPVRDQPRGEGELVVSVKPWATVTVKGFGTRDTPARFTLPAGKHKVILVNDDLDEHVTVSVRIRDGKPTTLSRDFRK